MDHKIELFIKIIITLACFVLLGERAYADLGMINIRMNATIVSPTCTTEPDTKDMTVNLPDYPGSSAISIKLVCPYDRIVKYTLSGVTDAAGDNVFANTTTNSPASGVGIQLSDSYGIITTNTVRDFSTVGTSGANLNLTATYVRTSGDLQAGNVQSVIGLTFIYP